ncbi:MAG: eCIS core domain-containing protein [Chitinophagales bacterium]
MEQSKIDKQQIQRKQQQRIPFIQKKGANTFMGKSENLSFFPPATTSQLKRNEVDNNHQSLTFGNIPVLQNKKNILQKQNVKQEEEVQMKANPLQKQEVEEEAQMKANPLQKQEVEEEEAQMKANPLQKQEVEEEEAQMKANPLQKQEVEEEEAQMKANPLQKQEVKEEEAQMKANPLQKQEAEKEEEAQMKANPLQKQEAEEEEAQMKANPLQKQENKSSTSNGLPTEVQMKMENSLGADFSNVNIHKDSKSATDVGALAYAQGNDVHFAPGQFKPNTQAGQELIGHELTHVVQQREGRVKPTTQAKGLPVNDDKSLEKEADDMGKMAAQGKFESALISNKTNNQNKVIGQRKVAAAIQKKTVDIVNYDKLADKIYKAIDGLGTDEEAVYSALSALKNEKSKIDALKAKYKQKYSNSLIQDIQDDFSGDELAHALNLLKATTTPKAGTTPKAIDYDKIAEKIRNAIVGAGTDEESVYAALSQLGQDATKIAALKAKYKTKYSTTLLADIQGDFSGEELNYVLELIGSRSNSEKVNVKNNTEAKKSQKIIQDIYTKYGIDVNSQAGVDAIKKQYTKVPDSVKNGLKTKAWEYKELVALEKALSHFAPILGNKRKDSTRGSADQEITSVSKVDQAIDTNKASGVLDTTTLGEYFEGSTNFSMFTAGTNSKIDFPDNKKQLEGTAVHEIAHGILEYAESDYIAALDYWKDKYTKSGKANAEAPITNYGGKNGGEDFSEAVMYYFVEPNTLKSGKAGIAKGTVGNPCPERFKFIKKTVENWEKKKEE